MSESSVRRTKLYGLDIETACDVTGCPGKGGSEKCEHALSRFTGAITKIAVTDGLFSEKVFDRGWEFADWLAENPDAEFTMHNGKFDAAFLAYNGVDIRSNWVHDSSLMAFVSVDKIPDAWLAAYEEQRQAHNKLRTGLKHRAARQHSLKTLAPYFLGVQPFWEPEHGHADNEYVLKDARYTLQLTDYFLAKMPDKALNFYTSHFMPWAKMLFNMEQKGIRLDINKLKEKWAVNEAALVKLSAEINTQWAAHFEAYLEREKALVSEKYTEMTRVALAKAKDLVAARKVKIRYAALEEKALSKVEPLNLDSPSQLLWLVGERLDLNAENWLGEESTDKETLTRLAHQEPQLSKLLEYRREKKLATSFYPEYMDMAQANRIHTTFNMTTARTGRLSSSRPNLQQVPGHLHELFIADPGYTLITRDLSAVEPTLLAYYSEDPVLCDIMITGGDFHGTTAIAAFALECDSKVVKKQFPELRQVAKTIGLAVLYGAGANQVKQVMDKNNLECSRSKAEEIVRRIRTQYKGVWEFKQQLDRELETGATIYNLFGRPFRIADKSQVYMKGLNTLIQGSASDYMLAAMRRLNSGVDCKHLLVVHDECVTQVKDEHVAQAALDIGQIMCNIVELKTQYGRIPIRIEGKEARTWTK